MDKLTAAELQQFTGSERFFRHVLSGIVYTEGVQYMAERAGAYWLIDEICLASVFETAVKREEFQVWTLKLTGTKASLKCEDGNGNQVYMKLIQFTDFPLPEITLWLTNKTLMLPSEY